MTEEEYKAVEKMAIYGGSFVKSLAECFRHADPINLAKLSCVFQNYLDEYKNF